MNLTDIDVIRELLYKNGFRFSKSMGQNFLTSAWVPEDIAESAGLDENTGVLEIGPGIGCLTAELSMRAGKVVSVELDRRLMPVLAETLAGCDNTQVVFGDILKMDLSEIVKNRRTAAGPTRIAIRLPSQLPRQHAAAMGKARLHTTTPLTINTTAPAKLEARLSTLEVAEASIRPMRKIQ